MRKLLPALLLFSYLTFLTIISLFSFGKVETLGSEYDDKLHHFGAHFVLVLLAFFFFHSKRCKRKILLAFLLSGVYGIIIEVLQLTLTQDRIFDFFDLLANFSGALAASILLKIRGFLRLNSLNQLFF